MKAPSSKVGQFCVAFFAELLCFFIVVANTRAYTHGLYYWTAVTDMAYSAQTFLVSKFMTENSELRSYASMAGFTLGGATGSLLGIYVTKILYKQ